MLTPCFPFQHNSALCEIGCRVLQGLLANVTEKHTRSGAAVDSRVMSLASNQTLQLALLTCAVELTCYSKSGAASFPAVSSLLGQLPAAFDLWEACGLFLQYLAAETVTPMAESVASYLLFMRMKITEDMAWQTGSSLFQAICDGGGGSHMPGDYALVSCFLDGVSALARTRMKGCAVAMAAASTALGSNDAFPRDCEWLLHCVLQEHLDLLFGQHLSNLVACCVYAIARAHGAAASFREITEALVHLFPHHTMQDFKHAELSPSGDNAEAQYGDTRQLYNQIFLPRMASILQDRFPSMLQHDTQTNKATNKHVAKAKRAPLKHLTATNMNTRLSRFGQMQT